MNDFKPKKAYLISIGDELLIGQVVDTNSAWIADQLTELSISVKKILTVHDKEDDILDALSEAEVNADLVFVTGGLGPTIDDITKRTFAKFIGAEMVFNPEFYQKVKAYVEKRGAKLDDLMYKYSFFPQGIKYLNNSVGTAPGMQFRHKNAEFFSMPGVPAEMKAIFSEEILPGIKSINSDSYIIKKTILTAGEMEAALAHRIQYIVDEMPENVSIAYLPNLGKVRIRITSSGSSYEEAKEFNSKFVEKIRNELGDIIFGYDDDVFEESVGILLKNRGLMLGTAESCTGGMIAHKVTSISGSSEYFKGTVVAYSNQVKIDLLNVKPETLENHGAVSDQTVIEMVKGALSKLNCDIAIATSGIAGPTGGSAEKPVGTIWIACGNNSRILTHKLQLGENRIKNIETSTILALNLMRRFLLEYY